MNRIGANFALLHGMQQSENAKKPSSKLTLSSKASREAKAGSADRPKRKTSTYTITQYDMSGNVI